MSIIINNYNQLNYSYLLDVDIILIPIGSTLTGSKKDKITIKNEEGKLMFQCEYDDQEQKHGVCFCSQRYDGGCTLYYNHGKIVSYTF
jgi:ethanolamine utilization cobalamin adenosyltransferase